jgi:beta-glucosidase
MNLKNPMKTSDQEKLSLLYGDTLFTSPGISRLNIAPLHLSDGPHGVREEQKPLEYGSANRTDDYATYLPTELALAATWNPTLAHLFGEVLGAESRARGKNIILGPGVNIIRTPLNGRNFEYFSEDPFLSSCMGVEYIQGVQSQGMAACVKHFAANNQETKRGEIDVHIDEQTLREIYLFAFERCIREAGVLSIMAAYNKLNGDYCAANYHLLTNILRNEWGFKGLAISDWNAVHDGIGAYGAGLDLEMGLGQKYFSRLSDYVKQNPAFLDEHVARHLFVRHKLGLDGNQPIPQGAVNTPEHQQAALKIAEESIVLLKNNHAFLPLDFTKLKTIAVIGPNSDSKHACGGDSSAVKPPYEITPLEALRLRYGNTVQILHCCGISDKDHDFASAREEALVLARKADIVIYVGGLDHKSDQEGIDRTDMRLPGQQTEMIEVLAQTNPNLVVVLAGSGAVEMRSWLDQVPALLQIWYNGMEGGTALVNVLDGKINPSGKLTVTFPKRLEDSPPHALNSFPGGEIVEYKEGLLVGYRWFDVKKIEPEFPFGHGLSYTTFTVSDLQTTFKQNALRVDVQIRNTGTRTGAEVIQVYLSVPNRPAELRSLKAFCKVTIPPGVEKNVSLELPASAFATYNPTTKKWQIEPGQFKLYVGTSSRNFPLSMTIDAPTDLFTRILNEKSS